MPISTSSTSSGPTPPKLVIPTLDLSPESGISDDELASTLLLALSSVGFLHIKNPGSGLTQRDVKEVFEVADELFELDLKVKEEVIMDFKIGTGYTTMMGQTTGSKVGRPRGDLKESFSIGEDCSTSIPASSPVRAIPILDNFRRACHSSSLRLLDLFALALNIPNDPTYFRSRHTYGNSESLRLLHYPPLPKGEREDLEEGQGKDTKWEELKVAKADIRAGAHQDFGSNTLLFQSPPTEDGSPTAVEGLEIFVRREDGIDIVPDGSGDKGWWVPAPKPEGVSEGGSILVTVGVSMEMWSGGKFKATYHRVVFPPPPSDVTGVVLPGRKSVVFFMIADPDVLLTPLNSEGLHSSGEGCVTSGELFAMRMRRAYGTGEEVAAPEIAA